LTNYDVDRDRDDDVCASFRWPVIVVKQLQEKTGKKCDDNERRHGNNGNIVKRGNKKYIEKEREKR